MRQQLLGESTAYPQIKDCMIVVTHTQALQQLQEDTNTRSKERESETMPHTLVKVSEESKSIGGEFDDELFSPSKVKACKSRWEKRQSRREHWEAARQDSVLETVTVSAAKLRELQENDTTLLKVCQLAYINVNPSVDNPFH